MAYYSKYSGKEVDERLDRVDSIPTKISQLLNDKDYITEIELKAILDKIPIVDFSKIPIDEDTIYWSENSDGKLVLKSKGGGEDSNWSVKKDSNGNKYIYTELPVVTQYGVTMYGNNGDIDLPSLYAGLPIDGQTIYWDNGVLKSIGGGGEGLDEEALRNYLLINGYATESWVLNLGYIGPEGLKNYVDISSNQDINGKKNFKSGISINGLDIYQSQDDVIYLDANLVVRGGITMFSDGEDVDILSIAQGLPFDNRTIWYNPDTQQIEVIGGTGGGSGEGVSNFWDLSGIPSWITNSKPKYSYSEIEGTPDLSGFATQNWIISQGYASAEELKKYIPISGYTEVSGEKNFTGGLKVNGSPIYYDTEKKYWKLEGDLLVTGGVTMYGSDSSFTPSTIMDALLYDDTTLGINSNGQLYVKGGTSGGGLDITALQNYLTSNSYLNVTSGDNRYLQLSGGTINGTSPYPLVINTTETQSGIQFLSNNDLLGVIINGGEYGTALINFKGKYRALGIDNDGNAYTTIDYNNTKGILLHSANYSSYALPLSGGTLTGHLGINVSTADTGISISYNGTAMGSLNTNGSTFEMFNAEGYGITTLGKNLYALYNWNRYTLWHSGNDGSGSGLDADLLDGLHNGELTALVLSKYSDTWNYSLGNPGLSVFSDWYNTQSLATYFYGISIESVDNNYRSAIAIPLWGNGLYWRRYSEGSWLEDWRCLIDSYNIDSYNAGSATKLQTARTIWGQSFDGTGNVSGVLSGVDGITFNSYNAVSVDYNSNFVFKQPNTTALQDWSIQKNDTTKIFIVRNDGNVGVGTPNPIAKLDVSGEISCDAVLCQWNNSTSFNIANMLNPGYAWYGSSKSHLYPNNGTQTAMCWKSVLSNGYETAYSIGTFHPTNSYGYMILTVGHGTTRDCFLEIQASGVVSVSGNFLAQGGITMYSDKRKKTILNHVELSLKQIAEAPLIEHYYNGDEKKTTHVGSIAQYWASMNDWFCKLDSEGFYTMEIQNAALASAISIARELDRYETKTDKAIKKLKKRICELEAEVERLKSA